MLTRSCQTDILTTKYFQKVIQIMKNFRLVNSITKNMMPVDYKQGSISDSIDEDRE